MVKKINLIKSKKLFKSAKKIIPLASQTFSRSYLFFDKNYFPLFIKRGKGQYVYDLDNNKYLDLISGLGSVSIGYANQIILNSVNRETRNGNTFSLASPLEVDLARKLKKIIPSAEMIRYGKNGTDVNSAAIRLARYYTKKNHIAVCGYHGWQDWYIASTTMSGGVPELNEKYVHTFEYNNMSSLENIFKKFKIAAVIMEPLSYSLPKKNFLKNIKNLCHKNKSLLIFDEICTGFRVSLGGAQKIYNVKPDISTFGKGMANGYPLSIIAGKKKVMKKLEEIFYSGTFAGEVSSLAACSATIDFMKKNKVIEKNTLKGKFLEKSLKKLILKYKLEDIIKIDGHPTWLFLRVKEKYNFSKELMLLIRQELIKNKILFLGSFNISYAHNKKDIHKILFYFDKILSIIQKNKNNIKKLIKIKIVKNLFQIRKN